MHIAIGVQVLEHGEMASAPCSVLAARDRKGFWKEFEMGKTDNGSE